jgi:hypothetical protein
MNQRNESMTYVYDAFIVANVQIAQDTSLVQITQ